MDSRGFTLIELVIVIAIIAIISAFVSFKIPEKRDIEDSDFAKQLVVNLRYTQNLSVTQYALHRVEFSSTGYQIMRCDGAPMKVDNNIKTDIKKPSSFTLTPNQSEIVFGNLGQVYASCDLTPNTGNVNITVSQPSRTQTVTIEPATGYVRLR